MTSFQQPSAFLFDMDGLLLDTERLFKVPFMELSRREGIEDAKAEAFYLDQIGTSTKHTSRELEAFLPSHLSAAAFEAEWWQKYEELVAIGVPLRPYVVEVLEAVRKSGAPAAVVTSTHGHSARSKLGKAGILDFFEFVKGGDEVAATKPNPEPYLEAAAIFGVSASACAAFEDSDSGTTSAVRAGCHTFQVPDLRPAGKPLPDLGQTVVDNLRVAGEKIGLLNSSLTTPA